MFLRLEAFPSEGGKLVFCPGRRQCGSISITPLFYIFKETHVVPGVYYYTCQMVLFVRASGDKQTRLADYTSVSYCLLHKHARVLLLWLSVFGLHVIFVPFLLYVCIVGWREQKMCVFVDGVP